MPVEDGGSELSNLSGLLSFLLLFVSKNSDNLHKFEWGGSSDSGSELSKALSGEHVSESHEQLVDIAGLDEA